MCYHKSLAKREQELLDHYEASFQYIDEGHEVIQQRFMSLVNKDGNLRALSLNSPQEIHNLLVSYSQKDSLPSHYTKNELAELKWCLKTLFGFQDHGIQRFHENGFDYLPTPIITSGEPEHFKLFNWGFVPFYMSDKEKAMAFRAQTLNCISEEMYEKPTFREAAKNAQRCLIPVTGFFEWRWLDEKGTIKIPYYITFRDQKVRSMAGLYSRWKDKETDQYFYSYTVLTTQANSILEYIHNNKKRMPVFIDNENEKTWLDKSLSQKDVLELCRPSLDQSMVGYTISKLLTTKNIITNVPEVIQPMNYQVAIEEAHQYLLSGDKKKALETFKNIMSGDKLKVEDLTTAAAQKIIPELTLAT
jgi:putative SOS response-associated peptidase YedK